MALGDQLLPRSPPGRLPRNQRLSHRRQNRRHEGCLGRQCRGQPHGKTKFLALLVVDPNPLTHDNPHMLENMCGSRPKGETGDPPIFRLGWACTPKNDVLEVLGKRQFRSFSMILDRRSFQPVIFPLPL